MFVRNERNDRRSHTDLVTPLGAYLRLRGQGRGRFLLESVERGRLGRHSFVGCGSRLVDLDEAEACGEPVVGYLGYDYVATPRADGAAPRRRPGAAREPLRRRRHARPLRPRARGRGGAARRRRRSASGSTLRCRLRPRRTARAARRDVALAGTLGYEAAVEHAKGASRAGDAFQIVSRSAPSARRRLARSSSTARCGGSTRRRTSSCSSSTGSRSSARRRRRSSSARDARASLNPIAGTTAPGRGRRRAPARLGEGPRRARDARRPRAQRPLARLPARERCGSSASSSPSASRT